MKKEYDIQNEVILAILDLHLLNDLYTNKKTKYEKIIPYPMVYRDIAILVKKNIKHSEIQKEIFNSSKVILKDVELFDLYENKKIGNDIKSMAFSLKFQLNSRTLTVAEVDKEMKKIIKRLKSKLNATQDDNLPIL